MTLSARTTTSAYVKFSAALRSRSASPLVSADAISCETGAGMPDPRCQEDM
jgi:hypothetical protein